MSWLDTQHRLVRVLRAFVRREREEARSAHKTFVRTGSEFGKGRWVFTEKMWKDADPAGYELYQRGRRALKAAGAKA